MLNWKGVGWKGSWSNKGTTPILLKSSLICYYVIYTLLFYITSSPTSFGTHLAINRETNTSEHFCEYAITLESTIYASLCTYDTAASDTGFVYRRVQYQYTVFSPSVHLISYHYRMGPLNKNWQQPTDIIFRQGIPVVFWSNN